ncbi:unnamed protein product [Blepharisma stoltei]|uniref:Uncharacterized protein n=1 Tax=Blepharisma stoltei TaxID=1481888 RepID=A0AAU9JUG7_9CILI|nr:unnamed protein product [Blepharisma stoltei]
MEDRTYYWLLNLLSSKSNSLNLLETYVICDQRPSFFYAKTKGRTISKIQESSNLHDLLCEIYKNHAWKQKIKDSGSLVCYFLYQKDRKRIFEADLKETISAPWIPNLNYIQIARPNAEIYEIIYNLRMEYTTKGYVTNLSRVIENEITSADCSQIYDQACDAALTLMILIEESETKRVMILDVDFIEDIEKSIWISFTREIKIAEPELCLQVKIEQPSDLNDIKVTSYAEEKLTKLVNGEAITKKPTKISKKIKDLKYTVQRGHIRNKASILSSPIKILRSGELKLGESHSDKELVETNEPEPFHKSFNSMSPTCKEVNSLDLGFEGKKKEALYKEIQKCPEMRSMLRRAGYIDVLQDISKYSLKNALRSPQREVSEDKIETKSKRKFDSCSRKNRLKCPLPPSGSKTARSHDISSLSSELQSPGIANLSKTFNFKSSKNLFRIKSKVNKKKFKYVSSPGSANYTPRTNSEVEEELKSHSYLTNTVNISPEKSRDNTFN